MSPGFYDPMAPQADTNSSPCLFEKMWHMWQTSISQFAMAWSAILKRLTVFQLLLFLRTSKFQSSKAPWQLQLGRMLGLKHFSFPGVWCFTVAYRGKWHVCGGFLWWLLGIAALDAWSRWPTSATRMCFWDYMVQDYQPWMRIRWSLEKVRWSPLILPVTLLADACGAVLAVVKKPITTTDCLNVNPPSAPPCYNEGEWFYCYDSTSIIWNSCWKSTNKELTSYKVSQCNSWCALTVHNGKNIHTTDFSRKVWGCDTGDCGDKVCQDNFNLNMPATLFEFTLGDPDNYDISVIEGFNLKMKVTTSSQNCQDISCTMETSECQEELRDKDFCWSIKQVLDHSPPKVLKDHSQFQPWTKKALDAGKGSTCTINDQKDTNFCYYLLTCNCGKVKDKDGTITKKDCTDANQCGCTTQKDADRIGGVCCTPNKNDYHWLKGKDADKVCHEEYWPKSFGQDKSSWIQKFKEKCPEVYTWQYDDTATKSCPLTDQAVYHVTFCA